MKMKKTMIMIMTMIGMCDPQLYMGIETTVGSVMPHTSLH